MPNDELLAALAERNRADLKDVHFQLFLAVPVTLVSFLAVNVLALPIIYYVLGMFIGLPGLGLMLLLFNAVLIAVIVVDLRRHPEESWHTPTYRQSDGSVRGNTFDVLYTKGVLGGMPMMTNVSDPHNLAERGRTISNALANLIMGGPRSLRKALAKRREIAHRSRRQAVASAERVIAWLQSKGVVPEADVKAHLDAHPDLVEGLALARELDIVTRRRIQAEFHYHLR